MPSHPPSTSPGVTPGRWLWAGLMLVLGTTSLSLQCHTILEDPLLALPYASAELWRTTVERFGGSVSLTSQLRPVATLPSLPLGATLWAFSLSSWAFGAWGLRRRPSGSWAEALVAWGTRGWRWGLLGALWCGAWMAALLLDWSAAAIFLARSSPLWVALTINLWMAEWFALRRTFRSDLVTLPTDPALLRRRGLRAAYLAAAVYALVFTAMNWGLWFNLQVPHGDSAMYEEHLWNLTHGKGFRSYLDQGLFLGEHIQVVHALLTPLYWFWPSHLLLELCASIAIGLTAIPVYRIALRHSGSPRAAAYLAIAAIIYFPLQYLDITIDFKTFRPSAFGVPLLLATIDQLEARRWRWMLVWLLLTLTVQEDFAIPLALVGLWTAITGDAAPRTSVDTSAPMASSRQVRLIGSALCLGCSLYLLFVLKVALPWFRDGATIHYVSYFAKFGETPGEIVRNMLTNPGLLLGELLNSSTALYAMYLLAPLGFLPVLSPSRLTAGLPLFVLLCLNELSRDPPGPFHHFHAPLLPLWFWAAAAGLRRLAHIGIPAGESVPTCSGIRWNTAVCGARFALGCALLGSVCYTLTPLGIRFWDRGRVVASRPTYWRSLYLPDDRAQAWERVAPLVPPTARVAATDFVHPRLTRCERSYDYSRYVRRVAGYADQVPEDADYIVIDLRHPYSASVLGDVQSALDVRELREEPQAWELLTEPQNPFFVVLRRRRTEE